MLEQKPAEMRRAVPSTRTTRKSAPTEIVEPNAPIPTVVRNRRGRHRNVNKKVPAYEPTDVLRQKRRNLEEDERLDEVEEVDQLLADQQRMQCSDWERC